jgi:uncharacterized protein (UPF0335 family)
MTKPNIDTLTRFARVEADIRKDVKDEIGAGRGLAAFDRKILLEVVDALRAKLAERDAEVDALRQALDAEIAMAALARLGEL